MPFLRGDGKRQIADGQLAVGNQRDAHRRGVADDLGKDADHVVEVPRGAEPSVPPRRVVRPGARGHAGFPLGIEAIGEAEKQFGYA